MDSNAEIIEYLNSHYENQAARCKWKGCTAVYQNQVHCYKHIKAVHTPGSKGKCEYSKCHYTTGSTCNLNHHIKKHFNMVEAFCKVCEKQANFKWRFDLKKHMNRFHSDESQYTITKVIYEGFEVHVAFSRQLNRPDFLKKILN